LRKRSPESHPNGNFYARIKGKRINLGRNLQKARVRLRELEAELAKESLVVGGAGTTQMTVGGKKDVHIKELAVRHLEWVKENRAHKTFVTRQHYVCLFLDFIGDKMVSEITYADLDAFYSHCRKHHGRGVNAGSHSLRELKTTIRWGEEFGICDCPVQRFPAVKTKPPATRKLAPEEVPLLIEKAHPDFADLIVFYLLCGPRPIEGRTLKQAEVMRIGTVPTLRIEDHKTAASSRTYMARSIPLSEEAFAIVERQCRKHPNSEYVFLNGDGKPYSCDGLRRRLERLAKLAGLKKITPYCLRHTFGTTLAAKGVNLALIAQLMGHSDISTSTRYIDWNTKAHQEAVAVMDDIISPYLRKTAKDNANNKADSAMDYCI